jgi:eukaryotic-like serine/threonine-protein kinase
VSSGAERLAAALAGRYGIERELGAGGMATVYLAHDLKHGRHVAIKVLGDDVARTLGAERFLREIRLAAKLSHPHILPLYDSGEAEGLLYYVMPHVEGASLRDRLSRLRMLPVEEAVRVASEVAGALDYAHRHGVVHRDIKPENILLHDEHAMVADFGVGKALSAVEGEAFTQTGVSVGTPAYMSPEQAAGESVDGRSDLYSLGCILYEMLVGEQPFTGATVQAVITKRFIQTPADVMALREGVPRPVARVVQRLLARAPADRYQTGAQVAAALAEADTALGLRTVPEKSIAVLPFASLSQNQDDAFFADGITEEILNALAAIPDLRVAGRGSAFSLKGRHEDPRAVGAALNVATVLEGTIRRSGNRVRIAAQLTSTADGYQLWSERYDRVLEDIFAVQDEIAAAIAGRLRVTLGGPPGPPPTRDLAAYELYLKGRALLYQRGPSIPAALECFQRAVTLDPDYAQAWAGLADGHTTSCFSSMARPAQAMPRALEAARRALALDPDLAEAHCALAEAAMLYERDYPLAERAFRRAIELNPNYPQARVWYGLHYLHFVAGRTGEGEQQLATLLASDPLSAYAHVTFAQLCFSSGRAAEAVGSLRRGLELDPASFLGQWSLACCLTVAGRLEEATAEGERALVMSGRHVWTLATLATAYARLGKPTDARAFLREAEARGIREYVQPSMLAQMAAAANEMETAIGYVRSAVEGRDPLFTMLARTWPLFDELRTDPRFLQLVAELKYPA